MKHYYSFLCAIIALLLVFSCTSSDIQPDKPGNPAAGYELKLSNPASYLSAKAGEQEIEITASHDWVVLNIPAWLTFSPAQGVKGTHKIKVVAQDNQQSTQRTAEVKVQVDNGRHSVVFKITQDEEMVLINNEGNRQISPKQQVVGISLQLNFEYTLSVPVSASWITEVKSKAIEYKYLSFLVQANPERTPREVKIGILDKNKQEVGSIVITQLGLPVGRQTVSKADIAGVNSLFISEDIAAPAPVSGMSRAYNAQQQKKKTLFKIGQDGKVEAVKFLDDKGDSVLTTLTPTLVRNLSEKFVYLAVEQRYDEVQPGGGDYTYTRTVYEGYLIDKSDGGVYVLPENGLHSAFGMYGTTSSDIQTDYKQDLYFTGHVDGKSGLFRMYTYNGSVDYKKITNDSQSVETFLTDQDGNTYYKWRRSNNSNSFGFSCHRKDSYALIPKVKEYDLQSYFVMKKEPMGIYRLFQSSNSGVYNPQTGSWEYTSTTHLVKIKPEALETRSDTVVIDVAVGSAGMGMDFNDGSSQILKFTQKDKTILFPRAYDETNSLMVVCRSAQDIKLLPIKNFPTRSLTSGLITDRYIYNIKESNIFRLSIETGQIETIYTNPEYQPYELTVTGDDKIRFSALELRTNNDVVVEIVNGAEKVIDVNTDQRITSLVRIN